MRRKKTLTLAELVVIIVIIAIVYGIARVSMAIIPRRGLRADARKLVSDLCWAREMAASTHSDYCVEFRGDSYEIYRGTCDSGTLVKDEQLNFFITNNPSDLTFYAFRSKGATGYCIGGYADSAVTIELSDRVKRAGGVYHNVKEVVVSRYAGHVKMQ